MTREFPLHRFQEYGELSQAACAPSRHWVTNLNDTRAIR